MTQASITVHSNEIENISSKFYLDYPMNSYIPSWKVFRAFTNENRIIAEHVSSTDTWNKLKPDKVLDIGTGDGLVLKEIINKSSWEIPFIKLVEPNKVLLKEAKKELSHLKVQLKIEQVNTGINQRGPDVFLGIKICLIIHVLYLLTKSDIAKFFMSLPVGIPLIIVMDSPKSLFFDCWGITAKKYHKRTKFIHDFLKKFNNSDYSLKSSAFKTYLKNPLLVKRADIRERILSMICYSEYCELGYDDKLEVHRVLKKYSIRDLCWCNSTCYELIKLG